MVDIFDEVKRDLDARNELGRQSYGGPMQPHDGRDSIVEAYEEALDLVMYLKKAIIERGGGTVNTHPGGRHMVTEVRT